MSNPFLGEIRPWALNFAPRGWLMCQGQILPISQYTALFSLIGTYYGGNGTSNFQLPDRRSRVPMKYGTDSTGNNYVLGQDAGEETITLLSGQMPIHTHNVFGDTAATGNYANPVAGNALATNDKGNPFYAPGNSASVPLNAGTVSTYLGGNQAHTNLQPLLAINWCIAMQASFRRATKPAAARNQEGSVMSSPYMAQILMFSGNFAPNYLMCNGQTLPINQYQALFSLLGTTYGGNGINTFQLPILQSSLPVSWGQGNGLSFYNLGQTGGTPSVTLNQSTVPPHTHSFIAANTTAATTSPSVAGNIPGSPPASNGRFYATPPGNPPIQPTAMGAASCSTIGSNQAHTNLMPSLCITFAIAIAGVFPSRN